MHQNDCKSLHILYIGSVLYITNNKVNLFIFVKNIYQTKKNQLFFPAAQPHNISNKRKEVSSTFTLLPARCCCCRPQCILGDKGDASDPSFLTEDSWLISAALRTWRVWVGVCDVLFFFSPLCFFCLCRVVACTGAAMHVHACGGLASVSDPRRDTWPQAPWLISVFEASVAESSLVFLPGYHPSLRGK